ncbi:MAG: MFS transporter, partial [Gluconacetobacter diazotrophicus]|nr:MFS transporter [Gluconacetobacter diazotrophicus]
MPATLTRRIVATASLTFACYFIIGLQLAVVPVFIHWHLGFSPMVAGLVVSAQYVTTLLSRPLTGHLCDAVGGKRTTTAALLVCAFSGGLFFAAMLLPGARTGRLCLLLVCRLILG